MIKENYRVRNHLEHLLKEAATWQHWYKKNYKDKHEI